nr:uncharacterized protein LOC111502856 [Leptinotarsa decemlineata]
MPIKRINNRKVQRKTYPKKLLYSNWETRNDSSNVNAVLHPDLETPRKFIHQVPTKPVQESKGVYRKCCLGTNTCYCREKPIRPRLLNKPNKCLSLEALQRKLTDDNLSRTSLRCLCEVVDDGASTSNVNVTDSDLIKKYKEELEKNSTSLHITKQREDYNLFRIEQNEKYLDDVERYDLENESARYGLEEKDRYQEDILYNKNRDRGYISGEMNDIDRDVLEEDRSEDRGYIEETYKEKPTNGFAKKKKTYGSGKEEEEESVSTLLGTRQVDSKLGSSGFLTEGLNIDELRKFRDDHYFETHAVDFSEAEVPKHTCIHQFKLDNRLFPTPINADSYGRSRCYICHKPMEGDTVQLSKSYFSEKPTTASLKNFSKCNKMGLVPRVINIGGERSKIELKLSEKNIHQFGLFVSKYKRPQYTNTFALRQQKMAC